MKISLRSQFSINVLWSLFWIGLAHLFFVWVWWYMGHEPAMQFLTAYVLEKSLSIDNLFVFILIFSYFKMSDHDQKQVLKWGIIGAIVMRGLFIFLGISLLHTFHWILYFFGAILIFSGIKLFFEKKEKASLDHNPIVIFLQRFKISKFMMCLLMVETTDLIFAVDSVPAVLSISSDPFIVYSSNIFAILGLRSLYFVLSGVMPLFKYLHYGLGGILVFIGIKMCIEPFFAISTGVSLLVISGMVLVSLGASLRA